MDNAEQILETNERLNFTSTVEYTSGLNALLMTQVRSIRSGDGFDHDYECIGQ